MRQRWEILADLINKNSFKTIVEVGVSRGINACELLKICPNIEKMYLVDLNDDVFDIGMFIDANVHLKIQHLPIGSVEASKHVPNNLDLVFIDANHGYVECLQDIKLWLPKVKKHGILCGHDYIDQQEYGVKEAVQESFKTFNLEDDVLENGNLKIWWIKND